MPCTKEQQREYLKNYKEKKRRENGVPTRSEAAKLRWEKIRNNTTPEELKAKKQKRREYQKEYEKQNPWHTKDIKSRLLWNAKNRAVRSNIPFNIDRNDVIVPEVCPYLGIKLSHHTPKGTSRRDTASLDRIDNTKGYTKGNVEVISWLANSMKNSANPEQLLAFAKEVIKRYDIPSL